MGMFDDIRFVTECPKCGASVTGFQSKCGPCCLATLEFWEVDNFYTSCDKCGAWIEFTRKDMERKKYPITDYEMEVIVKEENNG